MPLSEFAADISAALAGGEALRPMLQQCTQAMVRHLDAAFARIWLLSPSENMLELQASAGMYTHIDGGHSRIPAGQFKIGLIAAERRPHLTNSVAGDPRVHDQDWARREGMVGFAGYPLEVEHQLVGVMGMFARRPITAAVFEMLATSATQIAVGIERKLSEERERRHADRFRALHKIDRAITSTLDLGAVLSIVMQSVEEFFPSAAAVGVSLIDPQTGMVSPVATRGMPLEEWHDAFFSSGSDFIQVGATQGPVFRSRTSSSRRRP